MTRPRLPELDPEDRVLAGFIGSLLYLTGAASAVAILALPGVERDHWAVVATVALLGAAWGIVMLTVVPWPRAPAWVTHASTSAGFPITAITMAATGGSTSPGRFYLLFIVVYAASFYPGRAAGLYIGGCALVEALPLVYASGAERMHLVAELGVIVPTYVVLGVAIANGKALLVRLRSRAERLAAEQGALRRVATAAAEHARPEEIHALVAREIASLLGAPAAGVLRLGEDGTPVVAGAWSRDPVGSYRVGTRIPVRPSSDLEALIATGEAVRVEDHATGSPVDRMGFRTSVLAPVRVDGVLWGVLAVAAEAAVLPADADERLVAFADLLATSISNAEDRAKLAAQAFTDPLTGLANHRAFHERLVAEVARAQRHGRDLALVLVDVDHFKRINDSRGHEQGDRRLADVARCLREEARPEDVLARVGGDEFAWLLPELDRAEAYGRAERARQRIARLPGRLTISAGVCDLSHAGDGEELLRLADGALYWSKGHGRDSTWIYDPDVVRELSAQERAAQLERSQALLGLRALARAIDAKDPATQQHSERVSRLAGDLAEAAGWEPGRVAQLREAALVHDVGKIGVPDAVLLKSGQLTDEECELVREHAALGARILDDVLSAEQVSWVRAHHERPDGGGYPDGLAADEIPEGAALLAIADSWDVMTASRSYKLPVPFEEALAECAELEGAQFSPAAVAALRAVAERGALIATPLPG